MRDPIPPTTPSVLIDEAMFTLKSSSIFKKINLSENRNTTVFTYSHRSRETYRPMRTCVASQLFHKFSVQWNSTFSNPRFFEPLEILNQKLSSNPQSNTVIPSTHPLPHPISPVTRFFKPMFFFHGNSNNLIPL